MPIIINAGSENRGGTLSQATINAQKWLNNIHNEGFLEVQMEFQKEVDRNFLFIFTHSTTKKQATLLIHGFTDEECEAFTFHPRIYWNGSSTAEPKVEDWLGDGFKYRIEYYKD